MASVLNPYITFDGNAKEAMESYRDVFGGELTANTFGEYGMTDPAAKDKIMHSQLENDGGFTLMGADVAPENEYQPGTNVSISLSGEDGEELKGYWEKLSQGGTVLVPLEKQMWGDEFGMCMDRFGVQWLVNIGHTHTD